MNDATGTPHSLDLRSAAAPSAPDAAVSCALRYSRVAIALHWLIAALILTTLPLGLYSASSSSPPRPPPSSQTGASVQMPPMPPMPPPKSAAQQAATNLHKTIGIVILCLTIVRVGWRLTHQPPVLPPSMPRLLRGIAKTSHALFYVLLLVMPLSGWWMSSAVPSPKRHAFGFGIFDIPFLPVPQGWAWAGAAKFVHTNLAWLMIGLVVLHVGAALKHHFIDRDDILKRMLPQKT